MERNREKENFRPPAGGGRLRIEGTFVALLGLGELDERILERELNERWAMPVRELDKAEYGIYDPARLPAGEEWNEALRREAAGTLVLMPYPVYRLWLARAVDAQSVRAKDRPSVIRHYMTHETDWAGSINGAGEAAEEILLKWHNYLADAYFAGDDITALLLLFDTLAAREKEWVGTGYSDGCYVLSLAEKYLERSAGANGAETTLRLLAYIHGHFSESFIQTAAEAQARYALGEKKLPPVYWSVGTVHTLGTYPQTAVGSDRSPIEWTVLEKKEDRALLLSRYVLDRKAYNEDRIGVTWELCTLRKWLNNAFVREAFRPEERKRLIRSRVSAAKNTRYQTNPGVDTRDRLFLLSPAEVERYLPSRETRACAVTDYADLPMLHVDTNYVKDGRATLMWWLRGNSSMQQLAAFVDVRGYISESGNYVDYVFYGLRPAMWVRID